MPINFHCECGKPFWTAEANAGRRMACTRCGGEFDVPQTREEIVFIEAEMPRTSRLAIASLVLGFLSFVFGLLTGFPAVIVGRIGLAEIRGNETRLTGRGYARWGIALGCLGSVGCLVLLMIPYNAARDAAKRSQCVNNLKQIGLALHDYQSEFGAFPPAALVDKQGRPLLSWRVAILPYLDQKKLYDQFNLDEPWDSPSNLPLLDKIQNVYFCPNDRSTDARMTPYQAVVGPEALFGGDLPTSLDQITDGSSNTLAVVEAKVKVPWTKPDDLSIGLIATGLGSEHTEGSNVLFADGSVRFLKKTVPPTTLRALGTKAGGELFAHDSY